MFTSRRYDWLTYVSVLASFCNVHCFIMQCPKYFLETVVVTIISGCLHLASPQRGDEGRGSNFKEKLPVIQYGRFIDYALLVFSSSTFDDVLM